MTRSERLNHALNRRVDQLVAACAEHGDKEGNDAEIGDLQQLLKELWAWCDDDTRVGFLRSEPVSNVFNSVHQKGG